jgi:acyl-CoA thioesterase-1
MTPVTLKALAFGRRLAVATLLLTGAQAAAQAISLKIVAIGASNTSGWGVGSGSAYPERLQAMLRAKGIDAEVKNSGIPAETTNGMLGRIDSAVPDGTNIVILQPGGNDLRFFGTKERRTSNVNAMVARVRARGIKVIVYDPVFPPEDYQWDRIHINTEGHNKIAAQLVPQVIAAMGAGKTKPEAPKSANAKTN